jgi:hypothetical protein
MEGSGPYARITRHDFPVDEAGRPTSELCHGLLGILFDSPRRWYSAMDLAACLAAPEREVLVMLRRLDLLDFVEHSPLSPRTYRYNLHSNNCDLQARFETSLVKYQTDEPDYL